MSPFRGAVVVHLALAAALSCTAPEHRSPTPPSRAAAAAPGPAAAAGPATAPEPAGPLAGAPAGVAGSRGGIPLTVQETAGVARSGEVVANGVPLPRALAALDTGRFAVVDPAGRPVPAEFTVLARWNAGRDDAKAPIQWLLVAFPATVGAGKSALYRLVTDGSAGANPAPPRPLRLTRQGDAITVDTGAATFRFGGAKGALFDEVLLADGTRLVQGSRISGRIRDGASFGHSGLRELRIERQGPLTAAVVIEGTYDLPPVGGGGLGSLRRYVFTAGSPTAVVRQSAAWEGNLREGCPDCQTTKENAPNALLLTGVRDELALDIGEISTVTAVGAFKSPAVEHAINTGQAGQEAAVRQLLRADRANPLRAEVTVPGTAGAHAEKADGGMLAASGPKGTVAVALNHMHRYEPQALRLLPGGALAVDLVDGFGAAGGKTWLANHQGMFATFAVAALPGHPARADLDRQLWAPLNRPLRAWPDAAGWDASQAVETVPAGRLPRSLARYDQVVKGVLEATLKHVDLEGTAGLMTFGVYPRYWGQWHSPELLCNHDPNPEHWDDIFWCATWTDYHNTIATAPLWAMRSGEVSWLDEVGFPGALRTLHTQILQCSPDDGWFYCGQSPTGYGSYRDDFNSSHAYFDNLYLYYWLTGDSTVVTTLRKGGESMRRYMCELRGPGHVERPNGPAGPACPPDHKTKEASYNGRVASQWFAAFRFLGLASPDPSFLEDFRAGLARAVTQQYIEVVRDGRSYGFMGDNVSGPGTFTTNQVWQTGLLDTANLERFRVDSGDEAIGSPPVKPSRVLAALARTFAEIEPKVTGDGSTRGHWPLMLTATWEGERIGGRLTAVAGKDRELYGPEKSTLAAVIVQAGVETGDPVLLKMGADLVDLTFDAAGGEILPLGKLNGQYLSRLHPAVALLATSRPGKPGK
jgi:hypothetical protein